MGADGKELKKQDELLKSLEHPSWNRLFHIYDALKLGIPVKTVQKLTQIDSWFLRQIEELVLLEKDIEKYTLAQHSPRNDAGGKTQRLCRQANCTSACVVWKVKCLKNAGEENGN